jgi:hypothetical protein
MTPAIEKWLETNGSKFKDQNEKDHLIDYLEDKWSHKKSINFNYDQCLVKAKAWVAQLNKKNRLQNSSGQTQLVLDLGHNKIVKLLNQDSRNYEGIKMGHCVASSRYNDESEIYSLRDPSNHPHATIEIKDNKVKQIQGKANLPVITKYIKDILRFLDFNSISITEEQLNRSGYSQDEKYIDFIKEHFKGFKLVKFNNKEIIYIENKIILIKDFTTNDSYLFNQCCKFNQSEECLKVFVKNGINKVPSKVLSYRIKLLDFLVENSVSIEMDANFYSEFWMVKIGLTENTLKNLTFLIKNHDFNCQSLGNLIISVIIHKKLDCLSLLLELLKSKNMKLSCCMRLACIYLDLEEIKIVFENSAEDQKEMDKALGAAIARRDLEIIKFMIKHSSKVPTMDSIDIHYKHHPKLKLELLDYLSSQNLLTNPPDGLTN